MVEKSEDSATLKNWDYLDKVYSGIFVINRKFQILKANKNSMSVLGHATKGIQQGDTCYKILFGKSSRCDDCPIGTEINKEYFEKSFVMNIGGAGIYLKETITPDPDNEVIFLTLETI